MLAFRPSQRMTGRDIHESHRVSTPLELLFDLVFVVAVAATASEFHHALSAHHIGSGIFNFIFSFFIVWWAWLNFAWFASAYDTDDTPYRLLTMLQMFGALVMSVGVSSVAYEVNSAIIGVAGFVIMRTALATQWLRASRQDPTHKKTCITYAIGICLVQCFWVARLWFPDSWQIPSAFVGFMLEMSVPAIAERFGNTPWHAHHIAERYSLMLIIVLGECVLGTTNAVGAILKHQQDWLMVGFFGMGIMGLIFAMWWLYFEPEWADSLHKLRNKISFLFGYGHFFLFLAITAMGSGLELVASAVESLLLTRHEDTAQLTETIAQTTEKAVEHHAVSPAFASVCVALALLLYLTSFAITRWRMIDRSNGTSGKLGVAYVVAVAWIGVVIGLYQADMVSLLWLGWLLLVAPVVMTLACPHGDELDK